jgi:hypothetical protein
MQHHSEIEEGKEREAEAAEKDLHIRASAQRY